MTGNNYSKLLEPGRIGSVKVKSRLIKTGAHPGFFTFEDGQVPQGVIDYYEVLAAGGAGLVTAGSGFIDLPVGGVPVRGYRLEDERYVPSLKRLAEAIHRHDCPAFIQMFHMGPMHPQVVTGCQPLAASSMTKEELPYPDYAAPREMTPEEIVRVRNAFVKGALVAQIAGFDGIELNAACNHLLDTFLSRAWNRRQDQYGCQSLENRARFVVEIIQGIRHAAGKDFAIIVLMNGVEAGLKDGITLDEGKAFARMFEQAGADALHVRVEYYKNPSPQVRDTTHFPDMIPFPELPASVDRNVDMSSHGEGAWVPVAAEIKKVVSIPVIVIGRLDPELGERILREGKADFIGMNRRLMADHDLPNKIAEGRIEDIAPCTACMTCFDAVEHLKEPRCRINAALGKEREYEIKPAAIKKKVMIVGGGPAGLEAARVAALRGHEVVLYDRNHRLGGSMLMAATVKGTEKEDLLALIRYFEVQLKKSGVKVILGKAVTPSVVERAKPDVLLLAAGAKHDIPEIKGIDSRNVFTSENLHQRLKRALKLAGPERIHSLSKLFVPVGKNVVMIGGRLQGCQTAEFLVKRGRKVTIVDTCPSEKIGDGLLEKFMKPWLLMWLQEHGVRIIPEATYEEITREGLVITTKDGKREVLKADSIVTATPMKPNHEIMEQMKGTAKEIFSIGDAQDPKYIVDAIADGSRIARLI
jgi:2,4-dienoyl-CoA reductase (NADPH2)